MVDMKEKEDETEEIVEKETETEPVTTPRKRKRVADLDSDDYERVLIGFTKSQLAKLTETAKKRDVSRGVIIREFVRGLPKTPTKPTETESEKETEQKSISDEDLTELFNACEDFFGSFRTTGDEGFFVLFANQEWKLNQLTDSQYIVVLSYLKRGYDGFFEKPTKATFATWISELHPTDDQFSLALYMLDSEYDFTDADLEKSVKEHNREYEELKKSKEKSEEQEEKEATGESALETEKPSEKSSE